MMASYSTDHCPAVGGPIRHHPVMLDEVMHFLAPSTGQVIIDGTFGAGGYSAAIIEKGAHVLGIDRDPDAIENGAAMAANANGRLTLAEGRFSELEMHCVAFGFTKIDGIVLDIGVSSMQFDEAERGFSFRFDGPLDMRMEQSGTSAADLVNGLAEQDLARLLYIYGEERRSRSIARSIVGHRKNKPIETTGELAAIISGVIGRPNDKIHPATRSFQALRIAVNAELEELVMALGAAERMLVDGGRLIIVSFHSLEDRIVKRFIQNRSKVHGGGSRHLPETILPAPTFKVLAGKAVMPQADEIDLNPRARSAKLRAVERISGPARPVLAHELGMPHADVEGR